MHKKFVMITRKRGCKGSVKTKKRAARRGARARVKKLLSSQSPRDDASPVDEKEIRTAVAVLIKRAHSNATMDEWPDIALSVSRQLNCDSRVVKRVLAKLSNGTAVTP